MRGAGSYLSIRTLYFDFKPVMSHAPDCQLAGTNQWEVTRLQRTGLNEVLDTVFRFACHRCGAVHFETAAGDTSSESTSGTNAGYASKPVKVDGLWLWPGPRLWYGHDGGPTAYFITPTNTRPGTGAVGWQQDDLAEFPNCFW